LRQQENVKLNFKNMPLRAIINNHEVISSFLSAEEWNELKNKVKSNSLDVIIYQTQKKGYLRKSKKGLQHFVHKKGEVPENWKPESPQHLLVKNEILLGCKDAGWEGKPEFKENEWEADVLATNGKHRIVFEVQWSPQSYDKTIERQNKYVKDNIRCCWFFKKPLKEFTKWNNNLEANNDIPLFKIFETEDNEIKVQFYGEIMTVRHFVKILLEGKIKFSQQKKAIRIQNLAIYFLETTCWKCGTLQHIYFLQDTVKSKCGLEMDFLGSMWDDEDFKYNSQILNAVNNFTKTEEGQQIRMGQIKKRFSKTVGHSYMSFGCFKCDAIFGDWFLNEDIIEAKMYGTSFELNVEIKLPDIVVQQNHWCYCENNDHCFK